MTYYHEEYFKKDSVGRATRFPASSVYLTGGTAVLIAVLLDTDTGDWSTTNGPSDVSVVLENGFWRVRFSSTDLGGNTTANRRMYPARGAGLSWPLNNSTAGTIIHGGMQTTIGAFGAFQKTGAP